MSAKTKVANATVNDAYIPQLVDIEAAAKRLAGVVSHTPLQRNENLSARYGANIFLKREDLQVVRSFKLRGAYNKIASLSDEERKRGVVCASAGNHSQGVAYACALLKIKGTIFMPTPTPSQKIAQTISYGKGYVELVSVGDTFDAAYAEALNFQQQNNAVFVHPFDDEKVMEGQATIALEILADCNLPIDYLLMAVGGGGMASGVSACFKAKSPSTQLIGIEPEGAAAMKASIDAGKIVSLEKIDSFVDGAAVKRVGEKTFQICQKYLDDVLTVAEGKVCTTILSFYSQEAIVVEPAGALSIAALDYLQDEIRGKNVVCIVSGGNNDITRMGEIKERSLLFEGRKHYFVISFPQRAGALREFLNDVLGPKDDIVHFEYRKKSYREKGPAVIGVEIADPSELDGLLARMTERQIQYEYLNNNPSMFQYLI